MAALGSPSAPVAASSGKSSSNKKKLMAQMVKAAGQRQHWKEAIVLFDQMQEKVLPLLGWAGPSLYVHRLPVFQPQAPCILMFDSKGD